MSARTEDITFFHTSRYAKLEELLDQPSVTLETRAGGTPQDHTPHSVHTRVLRVHYNKSTSARLSTPLAKTS